MYNVLGTILSQITEWDKYACKLFYCWIVVGLIQSLDMFPQGKKTVILHAQKNIGFCSVLSVTKIFYLFQKKIRKAKTKK